MLDIGDDTYLSEIDDDIVIRSAVVKIDTVLTGVSQETTVKTAGLTRASARAVSTVELVDNDLFPNPPKRLTDEIFKRKSSFHNKRYSSFISCQRHNSTVFNRRALQTTKTVSNRDNLRDAIQKAKERARARAELPRRQTQFISSPKHRRTRRSRLQNRSVERTPNIPQSVCVKQTVHSRLGPELSKPLRDYRIPKRPFVVDAGTQTDAVLNEPTKTIIITEPAPCTKCQQRTQTKNKSRREAAKRNRQQSKALTTTA